MQRLLALTIGLVIAGILASLLWNQLRPEPEVLTFVHIDPEVFDEASAEAPWEQIARQFAAASAPLEAWSAGQRAATVCERRVPPRELVDEGRRGKIRRRVVASQGGVERRAVAAARAQPESEVVVSDALFHVIWVMTQYFQCLAQR